MKTLLAALGATAALTLAPAAHAQDITGALAGALDQFGQSMGESVMAGESIFVSAVGETVLPGGGSSITAPIKLSLDGTGETATAAAADRDAIVAKVQAVARRFGVEAEVGKTTYAFGEAWTDDYSAAAVDWSFLDEEEAVDAAADQMDAAAAAPADPAHTFTATSELTIGRPAENRMAAFVDALAEAGVPSFTDTGIGMTDASALGMWASLLGLEAPADPGEAVWAAATTDAIARAREQARQVATASGRPLGQVKNVTVFMRHQDGEKAYVTVSVRFGFAD